MSMRPVRGLGYTGIPFRKRWVGGVLAPIFTLMNIASPSVNLNATFEKQNEIYSKENCLNIRPSVLV